MFVCDKCSSNEQAAEVMSVPIWITATAHQLQKWDSVTRTLNSTVQPKLPYFKASITDLFQASLYALRNES
jgi:hypothetical protein